MPGVPWAQIRDVALVCTRGARGGRASSAGRRPRARAGSTSTSGSSRAGRSRRSAGRRWRSPATSSDGRPTWRPQVVEGGAPRRLPRLQPERQGPDGGLGLLGPPVARRPGLHAADLGRGPDRRGRGVHDRDRAGAVRGDRRPGAGIDDAVGSLEALLELSRARRGRGRGRRAVAAELRQAGRRAAPRPAIEGAAARSPSTSRVAARVAVRRRRSPPNGRPRSRPATRTPACRPNGPARGRRRPAAARRRSRSSRSRGRRRKAEALDGPRALEGAPSGGRPRASSRPTSSSTGCAAARRSGIASG